MQRSLSKDKERFSAKPRARRKEMTVLSVAKHLQKESKKKDERIPVMTQNEDVTDKERKLREFSKYYKTIGLVPEAEWDAFMKENVNTSYHTFRFITRHWRCPNYLDTVPGIPSQAEILIDYMRTKFEKTISKMVLNNREKLLLAPIPWYPNDFGWSLNLNYGDMEKYLGLKEFHIFLSSEKAEHRIQHLEAWSMLPPLLLRLRPHHKVLDLCASPGFMAGQISQIMHSDPNLANEGLLVLNEFHHKIDRKWCAGMKALFTNHDAKTFPDLYISDKNEPLRFDRVICDPPCSTEGTMRKHVELKWSSTSSLLYHTQQLAILRRGLELAVPGGLVLYSTTSMNPVENEAVIMTLLKEASGTVELVDVRRILPDFLFRPGMTTWKVMSEEGFFFESYLDTSLDFQAKYPESVFPPAQKEAMAFHMERCGRVLPHDNRTAGFFCAVLIKSKELPWIKVKQTEQEAEKLKEQTFCEPKKYGYTIKLKPQLVVLDIEWTLEDTNRFLQTRTKVEKQLFSIPDPEIDPSCQPASVVKQRKIKEDNDGFCSSEYAAWLKIKKFFKISDSFDVNTIVSRADKSKWLLVSLTVNNVIKLNKKRLDIAILPEFGVPVFHKATDLKIPSATTCPYMFTEEGFAAMYPYISKQLVRVTRDDILALAYNEKLKISQLSDMAQADIKETDEGCILFVYRPSDFNAIPKCNITIVGVRGDNYIMDYKEGGTTDRKTIFRLCGIEWEDYRRKILDEKLTEVLKKEREKTKLEQKDTS